jgi:hypothetical protein
LLAALIAHAGPTVGAFYYPWYGPNGYHWSSHLYDPQLGEYDSGNVSIVDTHLQWAANHEITFFLVSFFAAGNPSDGEITQLFDRADLGPTKLAILIEPDADLDVIKNNYAQTNNYNDYINQSANWFITRYDVIKNDRQWFARSSYLHDPDGRKILAFFHWDQQSVVSQVVSTVLAVRPDIASSTWIWYFGDHHDNIVPVRDALYPNKGSWSSYLPLDANGSYASMLAKYNQFKPGMYQKIITVCPSFSNVPLGGAINIPRDDGARLLQQLADIKTNAADVNYVIVTSFNEWNENSVIEPISPYSTGYPEGMWYLEALRDWRLSW